MSSAKTLTLGPINRQRAVEFLGLMDRLEAEFKEFHKLVKARRVSIHDVPYAFWNAYQQWAKEGWLDPKLIRTPYSAELKKRLLNKMEANRLIEVTHETGHMWGSTSNRRGIKRR